MSIISMRNRYVLYLSIAALFLLFTTFYYRKSVDLETTAPAIIDTTPVPPEPYHPRYKKVTNTKSLPIADNFPLANLAQNPGDLPPIPIWNRPPSPHVRESTPLLIGFTRNWRLLQQVVVSYITSGWPPEDIYVVENTGVMDSNKKGLLSLQNPFFLNHTRLHVLGVNIVVTPTLLTFAQLQNFYIYHAQQQNWEHFFWSHMDVVALSFENQYAEKHPEIGPNHDYSDFMSLYSNCLQALRSVLELDTRTGEKKRWAQRFFSYDRLALVNVEAFLEVGAWDTLIPFYMTDCDMHARLEMAGFVVEELPAGMIFDVASSFDDVIVLYRHTGEGIPEPSWKDPNAVVGEDGKEKKKRLDGVVYPGNATEGEAWGEFAAGKPAESEKSASSAVQVESSTSADASSPTYVTSTSPSSQTSIEPALPTASATLALDTKSSSLYKPDIAHSPLFITLISFLDRMQGSKGGSPHGRNTWQSRQTGGQGDPFYRNPEGFEKGIAMTIEFGRQVYAEKWGHRDCDIAPIGMRPSDAWSVDHDWD
jgi:hypothetical protein